MRRLARDAVEPPGETPAAIEIDEIAGLSSRRSAAEEPNEMPGKGPDLTAIDDDQGAVAVMLDLLNPAISCRKFRGQCRDSQETEGVFTGGGHFAPIWLAQS